MSSPLFASPHPVVIGHRGAPLSHRENTVDAFRAAWEQGATWVELDARLAADGVVVVHHDPVLPDGRPLVTLEARELEAHGVQRLDEVLGQLPAGLGVDVEIKNLPLEPDHDDGQRIVDAVAALLADEERPLLVTSFNPLTVEAARRALPAVPTGLLFPAGTTVTAAADVATEVGAALLGPEDAGLDAAGVTAARRAGFGLLVWTVDDPVRARELAALGVEALCTNDPAGVLAAIRRG